MTIKAILTDIEGTTTDIRFVHDVLFPYARQALPEYVSDHWDEAMVQEIMSQARAEISQPDADKDTLVQAFLGWIDEDKKVTALKSLQGLIWVEGYEKGDFTGHLYPDAYQHLMLWDQQKVALYVFSSGSVKAQKLLFGYSDYGDLTPLFSAYFDTTTGHKREEASYKKIASAIHYPPENILFLSDIIEELDAAKSAGMQTCLLARDQLLDPKEHPMARSFDEVAILYPTTGEK